MPPLIIWGDVKPRSFLSAVLFVYVLVPALVALLMYATRDIVRTDEEERLVRYVQQYDQATTAYQEAKTLLGENHSATQAIMCHERREIMREVYAWVYYNPSLSVPTNIRKKVEEIQKEFEEELRTKKCSTVPHLRQQD